MACVDVARLDAPALLRGQAPGGFAPDRPLFEQGLRAGFVLLADEPPEQLVLERIGQFWMASGGRSPKLTGAADFLAVDQPGFAKVVLGLRVW